MTWRDQAACRGMDVSIFYPEHGQTTDAAKAVCARCPVRFECRQEAAGEWHGVWGGLSSDERKRVRRKRQRARRAA